MEQRRPPEKQDVKCEKRVLTRGNKTKQTKLLDKHWRWLVDSKHGLNKDLSEILCPKAEQIPNMTSHSTRPFHQQRFNIPLVCDLCC